METIKVRDLLKSNKSDFDIEGHYRYEDLSTRGETDCEWHLHLAPAGIDIRGHVQADVETECGRCLSPFIVPVDADIEERLVFSRFIEQVGGREQQLKFEDYDEVISEDDELDLKDLAHQYLIMELSGEHFCDSEECCVHGGG